MLSNILSRAVISAILIVSSASAFASLIDNGSTTIDTESGLTWLDLGETTSLSINEFEADMTFDEWTVATDDLVRQLLTNAGFTDLTGTNVLSQGLVATQFMALFDVNQDGGSYQGAAGFGLDGVGGAFRGIVSTCCNYDPSLTSGAYSSSGPESLDAKDNFVGIWAYKVTLVSEPIPEPSTLWLVLSAAAGLMLQRRSVLQR